jgi:aspartate-semialdehyde dehydrogenase
MKPEPTLAIVGATGLVGRELFGLLETRKFPFAEVLAFAAEDMAGEVLELDGEDIPVTVLDENSFAGVDLAFFAVPAEIAAIYAPIAAKAGCTVIDCSSQFRLHDGVPLIVPELNWNSYQRGATLIATPSSAVVALAMVLKPLHAAAGLKRVIISGYQAVSGSGKEGLDELWNQSIAIFNQSEFEVDQFPHQIAFNCIPHIDTMLESGYTKEEWKVINETRKVLGLPELRMSMTCVRVPVFHSDSLSVNVETERPLTVKQVAELLEKQSGIEVFHSYDLYPMPIAAAGGDTVQVGRIRQDLSVENGFDLWVVADNIRKGSSLNAVQIAERLLGEH